MNVQDADIKDVIKQISKATGRNFIIDDKIKGKITIISERPMTREEAYQTFLSALEVAGYTIVKGPAGVIKIVPLKDATRSPIPTHVDSTPVTDMFITRLIPLQNISAVEMSNAIKPLISAEANLFAYPATNTLIITDSGTNIDRLMKIIKELDQEGPQQVMEIIPVNNASARDVAQMVDQLFEQQKAAGGAKPAVKKAGELEEMAEVSKIIPDERTNSIIVLASRRAIDKVKSIIQKLDRKMEEGQEGKIHVYYLKHAKAKEMAETLSTLTAGAGAAKKDAKGGGAAGPVLAEFEGGMKITADEATNSLVITATAKDYQTLIDKVVSKLDIPRSQVYLEAVVMELTVKKNKSYGLLGAFGGGTVGGARIFGSDPYSNTLSGLLTGGGPSALPGLLGGLIGRDNVPVNIGGEERSIPSMGIFLSALSTYGDSNIISTPNILTLDNQEAKIEVKKKSYYQGNPSMSGTILQYSTQSAEAGLILKITPQIGEAEDVRLKIDQTLSGFLSEPTPADKVPPPSRERIISTSVVTKDGQTVVLGGLMEDNTSTDKTKVPLLGDIPILGNLFKSTVQKSDKVNLLIFITPHIIKDTSDFSTVLKRKIEERNKFIEDNYGRKQRTAIRESIRRHREDLLEFKGTIEGEPAAAPAPASTIRQPVITAPPASQTELGETTKVQQPPKPLAIVAEPPAPSPAAASPSPPGRVKAPVITVPPPAPGARGDELDLAY
ncbi:MAG: type II secretion system secretin GspD [Deltaproteobacteria bacterium]|nr:type II secretion system secretin GspD [Deltaproteobacteria bacterium]